ncbi:hypothetical protein D9Q98_003236 [Chlorella vulgaris]|uniref:PTM/DIR17-like Tudor domain-containing protein n=1 Tax=Chlorella vulgaris TaxID=3077 RepID=A0A9D4TSH4_CHLVU|nr:hypothetical protein D9Q98_003236 [Chlorella vulgaris]
MAEYVGRTIAKTFPGFGKKKFKGTVASVSEVEGMQIFKIEYKDGDVEELELYELQPLLQPVSKPTPAKRKGAEASALALNTEEEEPYITTAVPGADEGAAKRHAAGKGSKSKVAAAPKDSRQAQRPSSSAEEEAIVRHPLVRQEAGQALCSRSTIWGGTCYVSCIRPSATQQLDEEPAEEQLAAEYETQARNVLEQLEATLRSAGSSKDHLLSVTVLLKDIEKGSQPWAAIWNRWCSPSCLPAALVQESFLGSEDRLVAVSATAALRKDQ